MLYLNMYKHNIVLAIVTNLLIIITTEELVFSEQLVLDVELKGMISAAGELI